jgi:hypothetical protein
LCISCIWHGICNMMYRNPCILDCMHFVSYALDRKSFSYTHFSPWNAIYFFVCLFGMLWLVWLGSLWSWWIIHGWWLCFLKNCYMYALSCVNAFIWSWHVLVALLCLICGWIASLLIIWGQRLICHHWCLAPLLHLVEGHKFLFVAKTFHVPFKSENEMENAWKICSHVICAEFNFLWVLNRCMMPINEESHT